MDLPKKYKFKEIEQKWKDFWKEHSTYTSKSTGDKVFSVDTPPPTVSGKMHMGHAFSYTQGDFISRFKRMTGHQVFYPFGTDDNGLPTEHLIEKKKKVRANTMSRSEFVQLCHKTIKEIKPEFIQAWKDLGVSCDFENSYSTIDKQPQRVSQLSFVDLFAKELVYRKETPTTWCITCQTAIAQADFENVEKTSFFNDIAFHDEEGNELIISTTRPELIPACVALFAHPEDTRYSYLQGKQAIVPLLNYKVPILFDDSVEKDKGTGLMMVCTFGDKEDVEKWHKYNLELRAIIEKNGVLNELAGAYEGLYVSKARTQILADLKEQGYLKEQKQITHNTNTHDRCGTEIEFMKTAQWFIKVMDYKEQLIEAGNKINWYPAHMQARYTNWVENLNWDWGISRQRHFGIPFPVWYEKDTGNVVVARAEDLPIDPTETTPSWYPNPENLIPEHDVMDTWATSSVTPQIALDWQPGDTETIKKQLPMSIRMQAHDIIRTWAFYTIVKAHHNQGTLPWQKIMVSGFVLDSQGKKMSKSKGNSIDPLELMDTFGSDAVRYGASCVKLGEDMPFQEKYLETGKKLVTKIFNASKFAHMHLEDYDGSFDETILEGIDKWILAKADIAITEASKHLENYEFAKARAEAEKFFWALCDFYLEIVKDRLYNPQVHGEESRKAGQMALAKALETTLKLFAPYVPFITEEVWSWKFSELYAQESIHTSPWPKVSGISTDVDLHAGNIACEIISLCRQEKNSAAVSQKHMIEKLTINAPDPALVEHVQSAIAVCVSAEEVSISEAKELHVEVTLASK